MALFSCFSVTVLVFFLYFTSQLLSWYFPSTFRYFLVTFPVRFVGTFPVLSWYFFLYFTSTSQVLSQYFPSTVLVLFIIRFWNFSTNFLVLSQYFHFYFIFLNINLISQYFTTNFMGFSQGFPRRFWVVSLNILCSLPVISEYIYIFFLILRPFSATFPVLYSYANFIVMLLILLLIT